MTIAARRRAFYPKFWTVLRHGISRRQLGHEIVAGIVVGIVALPLAIAFAIASGVKPEQGLYTAIVAGFLISALGGSRVQIGGPTGAFIVIVYGIVQQYGYDGLVIATSMAGLLLVAMGLAGLGAVISFIPYPVTVGFTTGIALIIAVTQFRDLLGLPIDTMPAHVADQLVVYIQHADHINWVALAIGLATVFTIQAWPRITRRVPGSLVAIVLLTLAVQTLHLPVETIGSRFGAVPNALPIPRLPHFDLTVMRQLFSPALAIALLAGIESLLSAVVADGMTGYRHRANTELVAQGIANIASPIFGGIPATGAIARTATAIRSGATTPIAGMVHALTLLVIMVAFAPLAAMIPMAVLAGILLVVAYNMSELRMFARLLNSPKSDILVLLSTFGLTVAFDLVVAIEVGVVLAALLFMRRMAAVTDVTLAPVNGEDTQSVALPAGICSFTINGPFFFGAAEKFRNAIDAMGERPKVLMLGLARVPAVDATAIHALEDMIYGIKRQGAELICLVALQTQPREALERAGVFGITGVNSYATDAEAVAAARAALQG